MKCFNKPDIICAHFHLAWQAQGRFTSRPKPSVASAGQTTPWSWCSEEEDSLGKAQEVCGGI